MKCLILWATGMLEKTLYCVNLQQIFPLSNTHHPCIPRHVSSVWGHTVASSGILRAATRMQSTASVQRGNQRERQDGQDTVGLGHGSEPVCGDIAALNRGSVDVDGAARTGQGGGARGEWRDLGAPDESAGGG